MATAWDQCCFDTAKLYGVMFDHGTGMTDCHFEGAELRGTGFRCLSLLRCRFIGCRFANAGRNIRPSISDCRLRDCVFEGELRALSLSNVAMQGGAFRGALHDVSIDLWGDALYTRRVANDDGQPGQWLPTPFEQVPMQLRGVDFSQARLVAVQWNGFPYLHECLLPPTQTHCIYVNDEAVHQALQKAATQQWQGAERTIVTEHIAFWLRPHGSVPHTVICMDWELHHGLGPEHGEALAKAYFDWVSRAVDALGVRVTGRGPVDVQERDTWPPLPTIITPRSSNPAFAGRRAPLPPRPAAAPALRERWAPLLGEYGNALALTDNFTRSPFGQVGGRLDLRGLPVCFGVDPSTHDQPALTASDVTDVDFTGAHWMPAHWHGGAFTRCVFEEAQFEYGTTFWATRWGQCEFVGGLLDRTSFQSAAMHDCRFDGTAFNRVHFQGSRLVRCRFNHVSSVGRLQFGGCDLQDCAFEPEPAGLRFRGVHGQPLEGTSGVSVA